MFMQNKKSQNSTPSHQHPEIYVSSTRKGAELENENNPGNKPDKLCVENERSIGSPKNQSQA